MPAGWPSDKAALDQRIGQVILAVYQALRDAADTDARVDQIDDAGFSTLGYTTVERDTIRAAIAALAKLHDVAHAGAIPAGPDDYFFHGKKLVGVFGIRK